MFEIKEVEKIDSTALTTAQKITVAYWASKGLTVVWLVGGAFILLT
jgi:hypothetical protein